MGYQAYNLLASDYEMWRSRLEDEYEDTLADEELVANVDARLAPELEEEPA